jgi:excisionase family DNA binding protein
MSNHDDITDQTRECVTKIAYRVSEAVAATGLSRSSLYELMKTGALRSRKCGRSTLILRDDLVEFLNQLR